MHDKGINNIVITDNVNGKNWLSGNMLKRFKIRLFDKIRTLMKKDNV